MKALLKFFRAILILVLALVLIGAAGLCYCVFDRADIFDSMPAGQKIYASSEKIWDAASPLLDLRAADILFSDPNFSAYRGAFMALRQETRLRTPLARFVLNRKAAASFYNEQNKSFFICAVDLSFLSAATRLSPILAPRLLNILPKEKTKNISYHNVENSFSYFKIDSGNSAVYLAPRKNLLIVAQSLEDLEKSFERNHKDEYEQEEIEAYEKKRKDAFCLVADANELAQIFLSDKASLDFVLPLLKEKSKSVLTFSIDDLLLKLNAELPLESQIENSTLPSLLLKLSERVQYYTVINAGTLQELKRALFPVLEKSGAEVEAMWKKADGLCRSFFSISLEDLLFSWTGKEFAVFGIEGSAEPVFALQIKDESERQRIFDALMASIILKENESLLVGGLRLPYIDMPAFLRGLLKLFNIELPRPYYLVKDGFLYLSESPQNLAAVYDAAQSGKVLAAEKKWRELSKGMEANSSAALYYNLARSVPFFLQKRNTMTDILSLYNIGRADISVRDGNLDFALRAHAMETNDARLIPGFPIDTDGISDGNLIAEDGKKIAAVFWIEDKKTIHSLELGSMKRHSLEIENLSSITPAKKTMNSKNALWAVTNDGAIYLLTRDLKIADGFPKIAGIRPSAPAISPSPRELLVPCSGGGLFRFYENGEESQNFFFEGASFRSAPSCLENCAAIYDKGFLGKIYYSKNSEWNEENFFDIDGIAFGSPCLLKNGEGQCLAAFITQNGTFYLFNIDEQKALPGFPIETEGLFFSNVVYSDGFFFALAADASLYRIGMDGSFESIKIPEAVDGEQGFIKALPGGVSVCADKNVLWAFTSGLEVFDGFPVAGFGNPVIAEANGDRKKDFLALSRDKKLYAWNGASLEIEKK